MRAVPPADVQRVIDDIVALLSGEPRDLTMSTSIRRECLNSTAASTTWRAPFRPGATLSYGEIAERLGDRLLAREVGASARRKIRSRSSCRAIACWRPAAKWADFRRRGGVRTKLRLLSIEGAQPGGPTLFEELPLAAPRQPAGLTPPSRNRRAAGLM